ncbi:2-phosphosulfolactate phosphatase [Myceligenerans xiligouense]|uniref:Probable 2-phosphosulfolactate phosphatase n=1 Tax=Myceligenerans xiligouense TaxID=253184 RepID=A0A3N4YS43_9MICO|nr:2-phosphosulfolactate phosphatase [Myceligenerans xiligouense]RPF23373.1 2-phosphosulfolactate phosphatase [Myceligenerans xiligouense]
MNASPLDQRPARVRTDWGLAGARALTESGARKSLVVVIDVLSFSTSVTVACEAGAGVYPFPYRDVAGAARLARTMRAVLAGPRAEEGISLSPASLRGLDAERVVLPSPNGSMIAHTIGSRGALLIVGGLRNASAVAGLAAAHLNANPEHDVVLVPAGERWPDDVLRPALEDQLAAGAIAARLTEMLPDDVTRMSAETGAAAAMWQGTSEPADLLLGSVSGRELVDSGFDEDVMIAAEVDATDVVPVLMDGAFVPLGHRLAAARRAKSGAGAVPTSAA